MDVGSQAVRASGRCADRAHCRRGLGDGAQGAELIGPAPGDALGYCRPAGVTKGANGNRQLVEAMQLRAG